MKTYLKLLSIVAFSLLWSSFTSYNLDAESKIIFTKLYVNKSSSPSLYESISIYDNGSINYHKKEGLQSQIHVVEKLTKDQLFKLKKMLSKSSLRYLDKSYRCGLGKSSVGNLLFTIDLPSVSKKINVQEGCTMPKALKELDDYLMNEIVSKIGLNKNQLSAKF